MTDFSAHCLHLDMEMEPMVFEVDLEYEFDAARWFDFTREESPAESQSAEFWFHSAPSYTPSRELYLHHITFLCNAE